MHIKFGLSRFDYLIIFLRTLVFIIGVRFFVDSEKSSNFA